MEEGPRERDLSPRMKLATRLYATGAVGTKAEAADAAGLSRGYFYLKSAPGKSGDARLAELSEEVDQRLEGKVVDMHAVVVALGRRAVLKIADVMEQGSSEALQLKAAIDLADRSPETQKVQKHQVESFSITGQDAQALAAALVEAARVTEEYEHLQSGDFIRIPAGDRVVDG